MKRSILYRFTTLPSLNPDHDSSSCFPRHSCLAGLGVSLGGAMAARHWIFRSWVFVICMSFAAWLPPCCACLLYLSLSFYIVCLCLPAVCLPASACLRGSSGRVHSPSPSFPLEFQSLQLRFNLARQRCFPPYRTAPFLPSKTYFTSAHHLSPPLHVFGLFFPSCSIAIPIYL